MTLIPTLQGMNGVPMSDTTTGMLKQYPHPHPLSPLPPPHRICARAYKQSTLEADKKKKLWDDAVYSFIQCGALSVSDPRVIAPLCVAVICDSCMYVCMRAVITCEFILSHFLS